MSKAAKLLLASQIVLAVALTVCTIIMPKFLFSNDQGGVSNYGVHSETVLPFTTGFIGCGVLILLAARAVSKKAPHGTSFRASITLIGILCLLVAVTTYTYKINDFFDKIHVYSAVAIIVAELPLSFWYTFSLARTPTARRLLAAFLSGFVLAGLTFFGLLHVLFVAEILTTFSFGWLMVHTADKII